MHESSQKLQLLRHSLEKCLQENKQQPPLQPAGPIEVSGDLPSPGGSSRERPLMLSSPSFPSLRPASLTGNAANHRVHTKLIFFSAHQSQSGGKKKQRRHFHHCRSPAVLCGVMDSPFFGQGLAYADLRQWIIRKCNLLVLDGAVVSQSKKKKAL